MKKGIKSAIAVSALSTVLCAGMLAGTTFAWFSDSVSSTGNRIMAGNLDIRATAADLTEGETQYTFIEAETGDSYALTFGEGIEIENSPIITETNWQPGSWGAKLLTVENAGSLAVDVKVDFDITDGGLTDALWFDFVRVEEDNIAGEFTYREMSGLEALADLPGNEYPLAAAGGDNDSISFVFLYGMKKDAGNEFNTGEELSFAADAYILAKQQTEGAEYDETVSSVEALEEALAAAEPGDEISVAAGEYAIDSTLTVPEGVALAGAQAGKAASEWYSDADAEKTVFTMSTATPGVRIEDGGTVDGICVDVNGLNGKGIQANGGSVEIVNTAVVNSANDGIDLDNPADPVVEGCYISGIADCGIELEGYTGYARVCNNVVENVSATENGAIKVGGGTGDALVSGNIVRNVTSAVSPSSPVKASAIVVYEVTGGNVTVEKNTVENVDRGITVYKYTAGADGFAARVQDNSVSGYTCFAFCVSDLNNAGETYKTEVQIAGNALADGAEGAQDFYILKAQYGGEGHVNWKVSMTGNTKDGAPLADSVEES